MTKQTDRETDKQTAEKEEACNNTTLHVCVWVCVQQTTGVEFVGHFVSCYVYLFIWVKSWAGCGLCAAAMQHCCQQQHQHVAFMKSFYLLSWMLPNINGRRAWQGYYKKLFLAAILSDMVTCQLRLPPRTPPLTAHPSPTLHSVYLCKQCCHLECH